MDQEIVLGGRQHAPGAHLEIEGRTQRHVKIFRTAIVADRAARGHLLTVAVEQHAEAKAYIGQDCIMFAEGQLVTEHGAVILFVERGAVAGASTVRRITEAAEIGDHVGLEDEIVAPLIGIGRVQPEFRPIELGEVRLGIVVIRAFQARFRMNPYQCPWPSPRLQ